MLPRIVVGLIALSLAGCASHPQGPGWPESDGFNYMAGWDNSGLPKDVAHEWYRAGVPASAVGSWNEAGVDSPTEAAQWISATKSAGGVSFTTLKGLVAVERLGKLTTSDVALALATRRFDKNSPLVGMQAVLIRRGESPEQAANDAPNRLNAAMKNRFVARFGTAALSECGGQVHSFPVMGPFSSADPYTVDGKCYEFDRALPPQSVQWLNDKEAIVPAVSWYFVGNEHWQFNGAHLLVMGIAPHQYQSVIGATVTPMSFRIMNAVNDADPNQSQGAN